MAEDEKVPIPDEEAEASSAPKRKERDSVDDLPFTLRESVKAQRLVDLPKRKTQQESTGQSSSSAGGTEPAGAPLTQGVVRELASRASARERSRSKGPMDAEDAAAAATGGYAARRTAQACRRL